MWKYFGSLSKGEIIIALIVLLLSVIGGINALFELKKLIVGDTVDFRWQQNNVLFGDRVYNNRSEYVMCLLSGFITNQGSAPLIPHTIGLSTKFHREKNVSRRRLRSQDWHVWRPTQIPKRFQIDLNFQYVNPSEKDLQVKSDLIA